MIRFFKYIWYFICGWPCRFFCLLFWKMRFFGIENVPKKGGFILLCNHQSWLDPIFVVTPVNRVCAFALRGNLFKMPIFGWMLHLYTTISIKRDQADLGAIKECIEKLKAGYGLVLYPEGTRTSDGKIAKLKPGFSILAKRASVPIIPVVIDGAFESWPRHKMIFSPGKVWIQYGKPMMPDEINTANNGEFISILTSRMRQMQTELRKKAGRVPFDYQDSGK